MASIKLGNFIVDARGKIAGTIYSKSHSGAYARSSFNGPKRATAKQQNIRQIVKAIQSQWHKLTEAQRKTWNEAAPKIPVQNRIGDTVILTGHQLFVRSNVNNALFIPGLALLTTLPNIRRYPLWKYAITSATKNPTTMTLNVGVTDWIPADSESFYRHVVFATPGITQGSFAPSESIYRLISVFTGSAFVLGLGTPYRSTFGLANIGSKIFIKVYVLDSRTGIMHLEFLGSRVVV